MATYQKSTGKSIQEAFEQFHSDNPAIFAVIVKEADTRFRKKEKFSVKRIVNDLRWDKQIKTKETNLFEVEGQIKNFKIGDQYISRYARLLVSKYPHMAEYIEMRRIRSL